MKIEIKDLNLSGQRACPGSAPNPTKGLRTPNPTYTPVPCPVNDERGCSRGCSRGCARIRFP